MLPTRFGSYFLGVVFLLFLISMTYGHSLAFATTFLFVSVLMISAIFTHFNLKNIRLKTVYVSPWEQTGRGVVHLTLENSSKRYSFDIASEGNTQEVISFAPKEASELSYPTHSLSRGVYRLKQVRLRSHFPFGVFWAWKFAKLHESFFIPPAPIDHGHPPRFLRSSIRESSRLGLFDNWMGEEFLHHDQYQHGHPLRSIDWKVYARRDELYVKNYGDVQQLPLFIDIAAIPGGEEEKLEQASFWIQKQKGHCAVALSCENERPEVLSPREALKKLASFKKEVVEI